MAQESRYARVSGKKVVVDTDILSMFAKVDAVDVLESLLGKKRMVMTPAIRDEIAVPLQYGYTFPRRVLDRVPVASLSEQVQQEYEQLWFVGSPLGKGELEAIAFCKTEGALFATNDHAARDYAQGQGVKALSLQVLLREMWLSGVRNKAQVRELLERIKVADYLTVPLEVEAEIFGEA